MKRTFELFDDYLNNNLNSLEKSAFELNLQKDEAFKAAFLKHQKLIKVLNESNANETLKKQLKSIHLSEFGQNTKIISINNEQTFAKKHGKTIAVAASTALFVVFSTVAVLSTGGYLLKKQSNQITELKRDVMKLQASNNGIVEGILEGNKVNYAPANVEGSAFALNNEGFVVTSFHLINGADSIFIQNNNTLRAMATLVYSDSRLDMAVLKINNEEITKTWQVPFILKDKKTETGEKVFTLGYPRKEMVYGEGSLSSLSGFNNDTSMYQISIPVNPGNSGGPLLDEEGNIIGVIRGKVSGAEATGFAIKANEIRKSIESQSETGTVKVKLSSFKPKLKNLKRTEQIKKINPYVFNVLVYKGE